MENIVDEYKAANNSKKHFQEATTPLIDKPAINGYLNRIGAEFVREPLNKAV